MMILTLVTLRVAVYANRTGKYDPLPISIIRGSLG